jgi:hypothetical protein
MIKYKAMAPAGNDCTGSSRKKTPITTAMKIKHNRTKGEK